MVTDAGLTETVKSCTVYTTNAECTKPALVPLTVTVYDPTEPLQARVLVAVVLTMTVKGVKTQLRPVGGDVVATRPTLAPNPSRLLTVTLAVPAAPA